MKNTARAFGLFLFTASLISQAAESPTAGKDKEPAGSAAKASQLVLRAGAHATSQAPAQYFSGITRVTPLFPANDSTPITGAYVTFEPGARSAWHTHPTGQHLVITAGTGWTQEWGGPIVEVHVGDTVFCPPGVKHWHGATPNSSMTHLALSGTINGKNVDWLEKVTDAQYAAGAKTAR